MLEILRGRLGREVDDAYEETFLLLAEENLEQDLGIIDGAASSLHVDVGKRTYTIQQSPGLLQSNRKDGTTGAVLWKITPQVADWLTCTNNFLWQQGWLGEDSTIVELGCGISGLIPLSLAPLVTRGLYALTDQAYVMKLLRENLKENLNENQRPPPHHVRKASGQQLQIRSLAFDWETDAASNITRLLGKDRHVDLILACDCIYNEYLIQPLVSTCMAICALQSGRPRKTGLLVCQQLRSQEVLQSWLEEMLPHFTIFRVPHQCLPQSLRRGYVVHFALLR